jgi:hypothetical protein
MASTTSKGNYYKRKSKEYYEKLGYYTVITEFITSIKTSKGTFYRKIDIVGSDGLSMNGKEIIFWNSKATTEDREDGITKMKSEAKKEFEKYPFPEHVKRQAIIWLPKKKPIIFEF